jgi:hypothetical protein
MQVHPLQADLHFSLEYIITDLIIFVESVAVKSVDPLQEAAVKIAQRIQITIGKVYWKDVVIPVVAILGRFQGDQPGTIFIVIIQSGGQLFVIRKVTVCVHEFAGGKYANDQRNPDKAF